MSDGARRIPGRRWPARLPALLLLAAISCAVSNEVSVFVLAPGEVQAPEMYFRPEGALQAGHFLELQQYLEDLPSEEVDESAANQALYGKVLLARGDFGAARPRLDAARRLESRNVRKAEIDWSLCLGAILWNDFGAAQEYAESAIRAGYPLVHGFVNFLAALKGVDVYAGPAIGETHGVGFDMQRFDLIRLPARFNGVATDAVFDTGASYSIVTQSFAKQAGVREIPDSKASGRGIHKKEFPITFGVIAKLEFAGFSLRDVPVMLMPDDALLFETSRGQLPVSAVLGLHLLKEFSALIDYRARRLELTRVEFRVPKNDSGQNLFFYRARLFASASIDRRGFYPFLLDTGSEPTLMTSGGMSRSHLLASPKFAPKEVVGIGKRSMEWGRLGEVALGLSGFGVRFKDILVQENDTGFECGIIGSSYLKNFRLRLDFARMVLRLERPR